MENFTPYSAFSGGILIGLSVTLMLFFNGRIVGISGMLSGLIKPEKGDWLWRLFFLSGLIIGSYIYTQFSDEPINQRENFSLALLILAGFLVGFGTRMSGGCTSGHGVCGIARFSFRSITATLVFMLSGAMTVFIIRHLLGVEL